MTSAEQGSVRPHPLTQCLTLHQLQDDVGTLPLDNVKALRQGRVGEALEQPPLSKEATNVAPSPVRLPQELERDDLALRTFCREDIGQPASSQLPVNQVIVKSNGHVQGNSPPPLGLAIVYIHNDDRILHRLAGDSKNPVGKKGQDSFYVDGLVLDHGERANPSRQFDSVASHWAHLSALLTGKERDWPIGSPDQLKLCDLALLEEMIHLRPLSGNEGGREKSLNTRLQPRHMDAIVVDAAARVPTRKPVRTAHRLAESLFAHRQKRSAFGHQQWRIGPHKTASCRTSFPPDSLQTCRRVAVHEECRAAAREPVDQQAIAVRNNHRCDCRAVVEVECAGAAQVSHRRNLADHQRHARRALHEAKSHIPLAGRRHAMSQHHLQRDREANSALLNLTVRAKHSGHETQPTRCGLVLPSDANGALDGIDLEIVKHQLPRALLDVIRVRHDDRFLVLGQLHLIQPGVNEDRLVQVCALETRAGQVRPREVRTRHPSAAQVGFRQVGFPQHCAGEVGVVELHTCGTCS